MGCLLSFFTKSRHKYLEPFENEVKVYSWDLRDVRHVQDYMIHDVTGETVGRLPGTVDGEQLMVQNCHNCKIYIFDHISTLTIDDCSNCSFIIGPVKQSVFLRNCQKCQCVLACQQFRSRDCRYVDTFLLCESQPIIESSSKMRFGCYQLFYPELEAQFKAANLSIFNNNWTNIHDFTPVPDEAPNFSFLPLNTVVSEYVALPTVEPFSAVQLNVDVLQSHVPQTVGVERRPFNESCLIVFFKEKGCLDRAILFLDSMRKMKPGCSLIQTKEMEMSPDDALRVFGMDAYNSAVIQGPVIGMEYCGDDIHIKCQEQLSVIMSGQPGLVFLSRSEDSGQQTCDLFFRFADMQMGL